MKKKHIPFNVIWQDFNAREFEAYDIMPYFLREWEHIKKSAKPYSEDQWRGRPQTVEELKQWFISKSHYMYWGRCEYEVILAGWPNTDTKKKIDIHWQIMLNIDTIIDIFIKNINFKCHQEEKEQ